MRAGPIKILLGVCLGTGAIGLLTSGPSFALLFWTAAPMATVLGLWACVCKAVDHFPDFAQISAEDKQRLRRQSEERVRELEVECAARERLESQRRVEGRISFSVKSGALSDPNSRTGS